MTFDEETLYSLLPAIYRIRDAEQGEPLKQLLAVIAEQAQVIEENINQLYDDLFIETCDEWVVPYIGDALGAGLLSLHEGVAGTTLRAYVANTIGYRRRKGTAAVLEQLTRDITQWPSHVVEFFQVLAMTQHLTHPRNGVITADLRNKGDLELLGTPFNRLAHTGEMRRIGSGRGFFNIPNIGIFLWRLKSYPLFHSPVSGSNGLYHFSTLGADMPLFHLAITEKEISHVSDEINVPGIIHPEALKMWLDSGWTGHSRFYGENGSLAIFRDGMLVPASEIIVANLSEWQRPPPGTVAVDPNRGRLAFPVDEIPSGVEVSYCYGFSADMGGGPYPRSRSADETDSVVIEVSKNGACRTLQDAKDQCLHLMISEEKQEIIIRILDNGIYGGNFDLELPENTAVTIEAAEGVRPTWRPVGNNLIQGSKDSSFSLNGFLVEGGLQISGSLNMDISHSTLVPGRFLTGDGKARYPHYHSLETLSDIDQPSLTIRHSICGPVRVGSGAGTLEVSDSILDSPTAHGSYPAVAAKELGPGPITRMERCTVFGQVHVAQLEASDSIFLGSMFVERRQEGCIRFCYIPRSSGTPKRYRCQPDLGIEDAMKKAGHLSSKQIRAFEAAISPAFTSRQYGRPGYGQLARGCSLGIMTGAENGSEMGAFNLLYQPIREANLRTVLDEYTRFGYETGIFYVT